MVLEGMLVLALDTSTLEGAVGWVKTKESALMARVEAFAECTAPASPGHAETLLKRTELILSYGNYRIKDVDLIVYGLGPGTFTGLRIGVSTVKGMGLARKIPILGMSSLHALALSTNESGLVATLIDARRAELYAALFKVTKKDNWPLAKPVIDEWVGPKDTVIAALKEKATRDKLFLTGNGIDPYQDQIADTLKTSGVILPRKNWVPSPFWMARIGLNRFLENGPDDLATIEPKYLREPDAKLPKDSIKHKG